MLKIKDDVDLKELEKFGFKKEYNQYQFTRITDYGIPMYCIFVTRKHKYIQIKTWGSCMIAGKLQDLLYELIKADLVEVVE